MHATIEEFINNRATMLANVFLTRKPTIRVNRLDVEHVQLLVNDLSDETSVRPFGVILWGTRKKLANEQAATKYANSHWRGETDAARDNLPRFSMPVLVLVYSVGEEDLGYYAWAWEPVPDSPAGSTTLRKPESLTCTKIHSHSLDKILSKVGAWHDALARIVFADD
jgi:hypothetical protein